MALRLIVEDALIGVQAALVEAGTVRQVVLPFAAETPPLHAVFAARVVKQIGGARDCIVRLESGREAHLSARRGAAAKHVVEGAQVRVQIVRTAFDGKLAEASTKLCSRGRYGTVYSSFRGVQNADGSPSSRAIRVPFETGFSLSDAAEHVPDAAISAEAERLTESHLLPLEAMIAALPAPFDGEIVFGSRRLWAERSPHLKARYPDLAEAFVLREAPLGTLFEAEGVDDWLAHIKQGRMPLRGGGDIRFGALHGVTVLDVNSGAAMKHGDARAVNIKAAKAIADLLPAANIGGLCMIDFIDMQNRGDTKALHGALDTAFAVDRDYSGRTDLSRFGCIELRRRKTAADLQTRLLQEPVLDAIDLIRAAIAQAPPSAHGTLLLAVAPSLAAWLEHCVAPQKLEHHLKRQIVLVSDESLASGTYQVALRNGEN